MLGYAVVNVRKQLCDGIIAGFGLADVAVANARILIDKKRFGNQPSQSISFLHMAVAP